jgi:D-Tyr-tRNAtyr deacylase
MIDKDGTFEYSVIRTINNTGNFEVNLYPNPVRNVLSLRIDSDKKENLQVQITDVQGKVLLSQILNAEAGSTTKTLNTNFLESGNYFIKIISASKEQWVMKLQKL